jgi:hypothetical protein
MTMACSLPIYCAIHILRLRRLASRCSLFDHDIGPQTVGTVGHGDDAALDDVTRPAASARIDRPRLLECLTDCPTCRLNFGDVRERRRKLDPARPARTDLCDQSIHEIHQDRGVAVRLHCPY